MSLWGLLLFKAPPTHPYYIAKDDFEFLFLLTPLPMNWNYKHIPPCPVCFFNFQIVGKQCILIVEILGNARKKDNKKGDLSVIIRRESYCAKDRLLWNMTVLSHLTVSVFLQPVSVCWLWMCVIYFTTRDSFWVLIYNYALTIHAYIWWG